MHKQHWEIRIILLAIVIATYGIARSAASTEQSSKTLHEAEEDGKITQLKAEVSSLEARLRLRARLIPAKNGTQLTIRPAIAI